MESGSALPWSWVIESLAMSHTLNFPSFLGLAATRPYSGFAAAEATAFRCLKALIVSPSPSTSSSPSSDTSITFDPAAQSCQLVLERVLQQTSNLRQHVSDDLTKAIQAFVKHKEPTLPTSTLELLKNTILQPSHPLAFAFRHHSLFNNIPSNSHDPPNTPSITSPTVHASVEQVHTDSATPPIDHHIPQLDSSRSKNGKNDCCTDDQQQGVDATSHDVEFHAPPVKKLRLEEKIGMQSEKQFPVSLVGRRSSITAQHDCDHQPITSNEKFCAEAVAVKAKTSAEELIQKIPDNCGHCPDHTDASVKYSVPLGSQFMFSQDSALLIDTEASLCIKCNEGGELLACCGSACPLMFHKSCLASFIDFDDQGNIYCPICAYSRAVSEYVRAKDKVSVARKQLALFIGGGTSHQTNRGQNRLPNDDVIQQRHEEGDYAAGVKN